MKKLSIEEKAKAYDEAINKAKSKMLYPYQPCFVDIKEIFPELKNPEDERIRKELIETIHLAYDCGCSLNREQRDKYLDWLKKQGEHKEVTYLTVIHIGKSYKCIAVPRYTSFQLGKIYKPEDVFVRDLMNLCAPCFKEIDEKENKVSEQKPTEWSIFDYRTWQYIVSDVLTKKDGIGQYLDDGTCKNIAKYMQEEWSKKLSTKQKPTWSKEDLVRIENCISLIGKTGDGEVKWLKDLKDRVQPQTTLSEEDEKMCLDLLQFFKDGYGLEHTLESIVDWLKSLKNRVQPQSQWKPSDEQMDVLDEVTRNPHLSTAEYNGLIALKEQLKVL